MDRILRHANKESLLVVMITLAALFVRLYGIGWGLPYIYQDDPIIVNHAVAFGTGDLNPHFFGYPSMFMYILFFLYGIYFVIGLVVGTFYSVAEFGRLFFTNPTLFYVIGRSISALLGVATVPLVFHLGKRIYDNKVGLLASLFLTFAPAHVHLSHYIKGNVPQTFLAMVSLWFTYNIFQRGRIKDYVLAGLFAGLSMSMYYAGIFAAVPLLLAHIFHGTNGKGTVLQILHQGKAVVELPLFGGWVPGWDSLRATRFWNILEGHIGNECHVQRGYILAPRMVLLPPLFISEYGQVGRYLVLGWSRLCCVSSRAEGHCDALFPSGLHRFFLTIRYQRRALDGLYIPVSRSPGCSSIV